MELDELKDSWHALDRRLDRLTAINLALVTDVQTRKARWRLVPVLVGALLNIGVGAWLTNVFARFWIAHHDTPSALLSGLFLHLGSFAIVIAGVGQLLILTRINFAKPVLEIQRNLALLHAWEARTFYALWLGAWLAWPAVLVVGAMSLAGVDLWALAPGVVLMNVAVAIGAVLLFLALHRRARRGNARLSRWLQRLVANHSIERARAALAEIDHFAAD